MIGSKPKQNGLIAYPIRVGSLARKYLISSKMAFVSGVKQTSWAEMMIHFLTTSKNFPKLFWG
ncbi:MAG TPA: hypothetical protein DDW93_03850 [Firmicutes bacterium]|nr:hypothetical protein [Bacillota bacterium]